MRSYVRRDLVRNPRRTLASLVGVALGVGLFSALLFFIDASAATLTKRAIAPVSIDMQRVLSTPLGRQLSLMESASPVGAPAAGQDVHITLTVVNDGTDPANDVVVNDEPAPPLAYVGGTTTLDGSALADVDGRSPLAQGLGRTGLDIGAVPAHAMVTLTYIARAPAGGRAPTDIAFRGTVSSREELVPIAANAAPATTLDQLARAIGAIAGVEGADTLSFVDLPAGSLRAGGERVQAPVRVFAFDRTYVEHYPSIRLVAGGFAPGAVLLSAEADRAVGVAADGAIELQLPGATAPLSLPVSGVADLGQAKPLFSSRKATRFEDFLYVPNVVVVTPAMFEAVVVPAFQSAHAKRGDIIRSAPVREVDVRVNRSLLHRNPSRALAQTTAIAASVQAVASDQDHLIDNISNTLQVAQDDAAVGRRMFLFLGLPAVLLASVLATYASSVHAGAQRREHATLRLHGADAKVLLRVVALQSLALAIVGAAIGAGFGYLSVAVTLGSDEVRAAGARDLVTSGLAALGLGVLTTGLALYVPTRRSLTREVAIERRELVVERDSRWRRWRVDVVVLVAAAVAEIVAFRAGAFDAPSGSVLAGKGVSLPSHLLLAPMLIWLGGTLLVARAVTSLIARLRTPAPPQFGPSVPGI